MDFRNKYLKYKPEITFDIFQKVWDKLIESGYLPVGKYDVERGFGDFKTLHCYLRTTDSHPMEFNCYSIPALFWVEATVQEILGYDPFVKDDDFVLPEKWCIKIPKFKDAPKEIIDWRVGVKKCGTWNTAGYLDNSGWHSDNIIDGYTEISFDQFKKYVLKQGVEESKEVIPVYVEALIDVSGYFLKGNIYKVESSQNIKSCRLISNIKSGSHSAGTILLVDLSNNNRFKPSTKAAFDLQNQPKQPIEQAVHCETQEQWDFVTEKLGYEWNAASWTDYGNNTCVNLEYKGFGTADVAYIGYQILSFSDWCAQSNYEFQPKLENFYVVCETEKESDLCLMWAVDNGLVCDTRRVFISRDFNVFEVFNGTATVNIRKAACSSKNKINFSWIDKEMSSKSKEDKYKEVLRKNAKTFGGEISKEDFSESVKNMFDFGAKNVDDNLRNSIAHGDVTLQGLNNSAALTTNNISETIDRVRYRVMQKAQTETLDEMFCASIDEVSKSLDNYTNKNKVQILTDNEIKINIIQKQSIKI